MTHSPIRAVVFDWAGTMIDFGCRAPVLALRDVFSEAGIEISEAEARADMGKAKRDHIRALLAMPRIADAWREHHGAASTEADVDRLHDAVEPRMRAAARECAALIPGAAELVAELRANGVLIGSSTGYTRPMMADILPLAAEQGYAPDVVVCAGETLEGRPSPLMMWKALVELGAWPASACVKVDDAVVGIGEGLSAGAWSIGLSASGNGVGLSHEALAILPEPDRRQRIEASAQALRDAGAHYVVETVADLSPVLDEIATRIAAGKIPPAAVR
ncbi:phosphonoacetaldehyde hydrolase [Caulobacter sp. CCNWLY153]|uniref:Phosphonoacetaldehyde hydrolase n=1 Tax=Caulobacter radicis TaxID=2172650 RepID=A0A2T9K0V2_9CAUL|nr:phosphonoacetaldehyde hydrolase [Caulobacter radicis]PVM89596.1 phosphonoacetaldehyde hydrolase [Caulobacter radicis]